MSTATTHLTDEQERAIFARDVSVALSAGAGCGKTFVLVETFLAQLDPEVSSPAAELSALVAITFTDRAAREMRDRIRARCYARLQAASGSKAKYWLDLMRGLDAARVSTIHAFCASLLRSHAVEAALDPQFAVLEKAQAETLLAGIVEDQLRENLARRDEAMLDLVAEFGLARLQKMFRTFVDQRQEIDFRDWGERTPEEQVARWKAFHEDRAVGSAVARVERSAAAGTVLQLLAEASMSHDDLLRRKAELTEAIGNLSSATDPASALAALAAVREVALVKGSGGKKAWPEEQQYDAFKKALDDLRKQIDKAVGYLKFDPEAALPAARLGLFLLDHARSITESYERAKQDLRLLDFNDLLIHARRLLTDPAHEALRGRLSERIRLLLVDEFQDTDPLQVELVEALCGSGVASGKLFFVGDFKQSIYRFRGARPEVFRELEQKTPEQGRLPLTLNFRSQPAILDFVNATFCDCFATEYEPLRAHRPQASETPAVEFLWAESNKNPRAKGALQEVRKREAEWIARRLRAMLDAGEEIVGVETAGAASVRPVEPGDIALLFRALTDVEYYEEALRQYGIDYYLVGGHAFYAQQEIYDLANLLRAVASPNDAISLAGVLRSPFFSLTDESLYWLAQDEGGLGAGLMAEELPTELGGDQRRRAAFAADVLRTLRAEKDRKSVASLINEALARTGYDAVLLAEFMGERKLANLRKLIDSARAFDGTGVFGLDDFILQLSHIVAEQPNEPLAATHPESTQVVRLMTIHQAKGLEFPVVVVPDLDRAGGERGGTVAFTDELGPLVRPRARDGEPPCCGLDLYNLVDREEEEQERDRLLYVACTRAADYLILSGGVFESAGPRGPWTKLLAERFDLATGALACALPSGYAVPAVKVTMDEPATSARPRGKARHHGLDKLVVKAGDLADSGEGRVPPAVGPVKINEGARRQFSFSRLSGQLHTAAQPGDALASDERSLQAVPVIDPLSLGTLVHAMLERVRFGKTNDLDALAAQLAPRHLGDDRPGEDEAVAMVRRFLASNEAVRVASARQVHRELEFLLAWPVDADSENDRRLQGYIDCLYEDDQGQWSVLDYKTNNVSADQVATAAAGYEMQMFVYALAAERVLGRPPAELTLYFLRPGVAHRLAWSDAARDRTIEQVNRAMASLVEEK